jgi:hypothetical protein
VRDGGGEHREGDGQRKGGCVHRRLLEARPVKPAR